MRYDKRVTLHKVISRGYDPDTGTNGVQVDAGVTLPCNVSGVSVKKTEAVFGSYEREVATVRLQRPYKDKVEKAVISGQKYDVLRRVPHRSESVFYVEAVSVWS